jgi:hypothetical protein
VSDVEIFGRYDVDAAVGEVGEISLVHIGEDRTRRVPELDATSRTPPEPLRIVVLLVVIIPRRPDHHAA